MKRSLRRARGARWVAWLAAAMSVGAVCEAASPASGPAYPQRPIRMVNPYVPGGITDLVARPLARHVAEAWGEQVIVDNRPGAGTNIGMEIVARAQPDGYTLLTTTTSIATNPAFYPRLGFVPVKDLAPVALVSETPNVLSVPVTLPARSVQELVALARAKPGQLAFASAGTGTSTHLAIELLKSLARVDIVHVPYKGGGVGVTQVIGGQVQGSFNPITLVLQHAQAGRLRALAVTSSARSDLAPDLPTVAEGGVPGYEAIVWIGVFAPRATPPAIVGKWNAEVNRFLRMPELRERFQTAGMTPRGGSSSEFAAYFVRETQRWAEVIRSAGIVTE